MNWIRPVRVLVAEDNSINQKVVVKVLERLGCVSSLADNGEAAVKLAKEQPFDLIFMDVQMPKLDGYGATAAIREYQNESQVRVPIIAMTAHAMMGDREKCLEAGMDDYLSKPITVEMVETILSKWASDLRGTGGAGGGTAVEIDIGRLVEVTDRDPAFAKSILEEFASTYRSAIDELQAAISQGDSTRASEAAHSLRGMCSAVGATGASLAAERAHARLAHGGIASPEVAEQLSRAFDQTIARIRAEIATWSVPS